MSTSDMYLVGLCCHSSLHSFHSFYFPSLIVICGWSMFQVVQIHMDKEVKKYVSAVTHICKCFRVYCMCKVFTSGVGI